MIGLCLLSPLAGRLGDSNLFCTTKITKDTKENMAVFSKCSIFVVFVDFVVKAFPLTSMGFAGGLHGEL